MLDIKTSVNQIKSRVQAPPTGSGGQQGDVRNGRRGQGNAVFEHKRRKDEWTKMIDTSKNDGR